MIVISESLDVSCPVDHGDFKDGQHLRDVQTIIQEAALDVNQWPLLTAEISMECSQRLATRYLNGRDVISPSYSLAEAEITGNVRRVTTQALGSRAVYAAMPGIREILEPGFGNNANLLPAEYNAPMGHVHNGEEAILMRLVSGKIGRMAARTLGNFKMEERLAMQDSFEDWTRRAALSTRYALDRRYGRSWRYLPKEIRQSPYESDLKDRVLMRLLGGLVHRSYSLETSFYNAAVSGAEAGTVTLKHFRQALHAAGCHRSLWAPLAYANAAKLSLPASMTFWDAKQLNEVDVREQSQSMYIAYRHNGAWQINFANSKYQKIYNHNRPEGCQGAFLLPPQNEDDQAKLSDWHAFMAEKSQNFRMDTDYRRGTSAAQMATLNTIAVADKEGYI